MDVRVTGAELWVNDPLTRKNCPLLLSARCYWVLTYSRENSCHDAGGGRPPAAEPASPGWPNGALVSAKRILTDRQRKLGIGSLSLF